VKRNASKRIVLDSTDSIMEKEGQKDNKSGNLY
jgi:hypothetical protein